MSSNTKYISATAATAAALGCAGALAYFAHQKTNRGNSSSKDVMTSVSRGQQSVDSVSPLPLSPDLYVIDFSMHSENRKKIMERMHNLNRVSKKGSKDGDKKKKKNDVHSAILLHGGVELSKYDTDTCYHFRQESFFQYLFGVKEPGCAGAIDLKTKEAILFVPRLSDEWELWCGKRSTLEEWKETYGVDAVHYMDELPSVLESRGINYLYRLEGTNTDSGLTTTTKSDFEGISKFEINDADLYPEMVECRVIKTKKELDLLRYVNGISSLAHMEVMKQIQPKMFEFHAESTFIHYCYSHGGARLQAYTCICGSGSNASTLHYGHAGAPNSKRLQNGDLLLNDMGAEYHCYASDITCTFPVNGKFTRDQTMIYVGVLKSHDAVMAAIKPGVEWKAMHVLSHRVLTEHLLEHGLFQNGTVDELLSHGVSTYFYPHGLGHLMGLDVHDVGGYPKGVERSNERIYSKLRCGRVLEENMVLTIEPGCYFIEAQLEECLGNPDVAKFINREILERYRGSGGVRIESNIVVTSSGAENMTKVPRTIQQIEAWMNSKNNSK